MSIHAGVGKFRITRSLGATLITASDTSLHCPRRTKAHQIHRCPFGLKAKKCALYRWKLVYCDQVLLQFSSLINNWGRWPYCGGSAWPDGVLLFDPAATCRHRHNGDGGLRSEFRGRRSVCFGGRFARKSKAQFAHCVTLWQATRKARNQIFRSRVAVGEPCIASAYRY